jgi:hypothetical protein
MSFLQQFCFHEIKLYWQFPGFVLCDLRKHLRKQFLLLISIINYMYNINSNNIIIINTQIHKGIIPCVFHVGKKTKRHNI